MNQDNYIILYDTLDSVEVIHRAQTLKEAVAKLMKLDPNIQTNSTIYRAVKDWGVVEK